MFKKKIIFSFFFALLIISINCKGEKMSDKSMCLEIKNVPESTWRKLTEKRIYFGHQSVGFNIIDGVMDVMKENPQIELKIEENNAQAIFARPIFAHSRIGENMDPNSKIEAFSEFMEKGVGDKTNFAFFKFCYVDITGGTDVAKVFSHYKDTMKRLNEKFKNTVFIHITVPLTIVQKGPKVLIKKVIGRPIGGYSENIKRNQFNDLLRKEFEGKDPIFDLAAIESTFPDGKRELFIVESHTYYALIPAYTDDGGHLNEKGRKIVAQQFLILLGDLSDQRGRIN